MADVFEPTAVVVVWDLIADLARDVRRVLVAVAEIAERTGLDRAEIEGALGQLGEAGLVSTWDAGSGPVATLTDLAARKTLGLKLRRVSGGMAGLAWVPVDARERQERYRPKRIRSATDAGVDLDGIAGDAPDPVDRVVAAEEAERAGARMGKRLADADLNPDRLPRPTVILTGCQPWGGPLSGPCPACKGSPLGPKTFCARCGRWGLDWLLARIWRASDKAEAEKVAAKAKKGRRSLAQRKAGATA